MEALQAQSWREPYLKEKEIKKAIKDLSNKDEKKRTKAAMLLGNSGQDGLELGVVDHLIIALNDKNPNVRSWVAASLGKLGPPAKKSIGFLIRALDDMDDVVVQESVSAIKKIEPTYSGNTKEEIISEYQRRLDIQSEQEYWNYQAESMTRDELYEKYYSLAEAAQVNLDEDDYYDGRMYLEKAEFWAKKLKYKEGLEWIHEKIKLCDKYLKLRGEHEQEMGKFENLLGKIAFKSQFKLEDGIFEDIIQKIALEEVDKRVKIIKKYQNIFEDSFSTENIANFFISHGTSMIKEWFVQIFSMDPARINVECPPSISSIDIRVNITYLFSTRNVFLIKELAEKYKTDYQEGRFEFLFIASAIKTLSDYFQDIFSADYQLFTINIATERTFEGLLVKYQGNGSFAS